MFPTQFVTFPAGPAFLRRLVLLLLSSTLVLFLAGTAVASIEGPRPAVADAFASGAWQVDELPDVAVLVTGAEADQDVIERSIIPAIKDLNGVAAVVSELSESGQVALHVSLVPESGTALPSEDAQPVSPDETVASIKALFEEQLPRATVAIGGRAVADQDLLNSLNRGAILAVVPVIALMTVLLAAGLGMRYGLAAGTTVAVSALVGGIIGSRIAGPFDGSLGSTAVPAVLVAVLVSSVLTFRLMDWFKHRGWTEGSVTEGDADIRRAIGHLAPEAGLLFGGLIVTAIVFELLGSSRAPASGVAVGGLVAAVVTLGGLSAVLASLPPAIDEEDYQLVRAHIPDGRDVPLAVLAGFTCFLLGLGLFAIRTPSTDLLDESALPSGSMSRRVSEQLVALGGDPSSSVLVELAAVGPDAASDRTVADWARQTSAINGVGWVETTTGRYMHGELVAAPISAAAFLNENLTMAIITPAVSARSSAAQGIVEQVEADLSSNSELSGALSGPSVAAATTANEGASLLWPLVLLLAAAGGLSVLLLVNDVTLAALSAGLRLVGSAAVLGVYHVVGGDVGGNELQIAALILSVGVGLFEIGFLRRIRDDLAAAERSDEVVAPADDDRQRSNIVGEAFRVEGRAAMLGLGVTALCGLGLLGSDLGVARQLGVAVAVGLVLELLIGTWLLRPAVLGERALGLSLLGRVAVPDRSPSGVEVAVAGTATGVEASEPYLPADLLASLESLSHPANSAKEPLMSMFKRKNGQSGSARRGDLDTAAVSGSAALAGDGGSDPVFGAEAAPDLASAMGTSDETQTMDPQWRRIIAGLLRSEFAFQTDPERAQLETVFVADTPLFSELLQHNRRLRRSGLKVAGRGPEVLKLTVVNDESPVTLAVTVHHPPRQLLDRDGNLLGTRPAERREGLMWLVRDPSGRYRIAEAVDLGEVTPVSAPETALARETDEATSAENLATKP